MKAFINQLIQDQKKLYCENYHQVVRDYNEEVGTVKGYNGRQLLELLQNCDDEGSPEVLIKLDTALKTISISNNGTPFSEKGYRSLFIANLSPKSATRKYIGNKGLGFRSIINWSSAIEIQSNSLSLNYSEQNRKDNFSLLYSSEFTEQIRTEYGFAETVFPMPFLSIPELTEIKQDGYVTTIKIFYKELFFQDILDQVKNITAETLLFLRNIQEVKFVGFADRENIICLKESINAGKQEFLPRQQVVYEGSSWEIFEEDNALPIEFADSDKKEKEHYQIKIAVEEKLRQNTPFLYSFFPTNIRLSQPYILHATFDLDATRNQIVNTAKNKYILAQVVNFTIQVAKFYAAQKVSYRPLQILKHIHFADSLTNLGYYQLVKAAIAREHVFPCIDNTYKTLEKVVYVDDDFANMLMDFGATQILDCHLIPIESKELEKAIPLEEIDKSISVFDNSLEIINDIAALPLSINQRALFIKKLVRDCSFLKSSFPNQVNVLTKKNGDIINGSEYIYTPITQGEELATPDFTKIQFLEKDLFDQLVIQLEYKPSENNVKSRFIYEQLNGFCNIHSYEPATLSQKIVSETNNRVKEFPQHAIADIQNMNRCLFSNFSKLDDETKKSPLRISVPTINLGGEVALAENVILSIHYPSGKKNEAIFEGVYDAGNYVAIAADLGITDFINIQEVEAYLLWLGVRRFAKYFKQTTKNQLLDYTNYIVSLKNIGRHTAYEITYIDIENFENIINKLNLNQLITWIYFDVTFKKQLNNNNNNDIFKYHYHSWYPPLTDKPSYLKYQLINKVGINFENFLLDEKFPWVNTDILDYRANIFVANAISKTSINEILMLLGAKDDFNLLSIGKVADILNRLAERYPDGKRSQAFYKRALNHYKLNKQELKMPVKLFADDGTGLKLYAQKEIYFSDKIKLPNQLKKEFPLFNFPLRSGGAEAIKFFKINDLKDIKIEIKSVANLPDLTNEFISYFELLKPLIICQRINAIEDPAQQKEQAAISNRIQFKLCSEIIYSVKEKEYEVADYEFLQVSDMTYFVKVHTYDSLKKLRKNSFFIESFADIISVSFDISGEKNEFKYLLRNDFEDALLSTKNDYGEDTILEAKSLLGLSDYKQAFWAAVFISKGIAFEEHLDDKALELYLKENLHIDYRVSDIDYESLNNSLELKKIETLFTTINLSLRDFASYYQYKISIQSLHFENLQNEILRYKTKVKKDLWYKLKDGLIEEKAKFLELINKFENYEDFAIEKSQIAEFEFSISLNNLVDEYIYGLYGPLPSGQLQNLDECRNVNLERFSNEEQYIIQQSERLRSLLFFDDAISTIKEEIKIQSDDEGITPNENAEVKKKVEIIDSKLLLPKAISPSGKVKKGVYIPKELNNRKQKDKGNIAEKIVFDYLNENFEEVYWAAKDNEGLHYDIRYLNKENIIKYVEAKSFDNGFFYISKDEYEFGERQKDNYEIWLVQDQYKIIPITDFFHNDKYEPITNEYLVYMDIKEN
jgi:hypothetical protein